MNEFRALKKLHRIASELLKAVTNAQTEYNSMRANNEDVARYGEVLSRREALRRRVRQSPDHKPARFARLEKKIDELDMVITDCEMRASKSAWIYGCTMRHIGQKQLELLRVKLPSYAYEFLPDKSDDDYFENL
jgi:hypothetical protein